MAPSVQERFKRGLIAATLRFRMPTLRRSTRSSSIAPFVVLSLVLLLSACGGSSGPGGSPEPTGTRDVAGSVAMPVGNDVDLDTLTIHTSVGSYPVAADGTFSVDVAAGADTEIGVETAGGELLLLGISRGGDVVLSPASTAEALLYYLVGAMWLPAEHQDTVRDLLSDRVETDALAAELERQLVSGTNGLAEPDQGTVDALTAAHQALFADVEVAALAGVAARAAGDRRSRPVAPADGVAPSQRTHFEGAPLVVPAALDGTNIVIDPSGTVQSGVQVLQNPTGSGVVAQNEVRRPAALLAYEVAWENADGVETPTDPPRLVGQVDVPATGQLELLEALFDVVTGDAPWSPVLSPPVDLPGRDNASRTHYRLVVLAPSISTTVPAIMSDPTFAEFHDEWDDIIQEKSLELFLDELLLPLVEVYGLGKLAQYDAQKLTQMRARVHRLADEHLLGLGVYLRAGRSGYADALRFAIDRLVESREFRLELMDTIFDALAKSDQNRFAIESLERRLAGRASASGVTAAVQAMLVAGDVAKIMSDLQGAPAVEWAAISAPALFALSPAQATVTRDSPSAQFTVVPKGSISGHFVYRWSTSGTHGEISDLLEDGLQIVTTSNEIWYFHDRPSGIEDTDVDTISVEVFEVDEGVSSVPPGAEPVARMSASVQGDDRLIDPRIDVRYGSTNTGLYGTSYACIEMYLRFDAVPGAETYTVRVRNVGGQGDERNSNQDFRLRGSSHDVFIDPDARAGEGNVWEEGAVLDWTGVCNWRRDGRYTLPPYTLLAFYDGAEDQYLVHLFVSVETGFHTPASVLVPLWYDWVEDATFEVVVGR